MAVCGDQKDVMTNIADRKSAYDVISIENGETEYIPIKDLKEEIEAQKLAGKLFGSIERNEDDYVRIFESSIIWYCRGNHGVAAHQQYRTHDSGR